MQIVCDNTVSYGQMTHLIDGIRAFVTAANMRGYIINLSSFINKCPEKSGLEPLKLVRYKSATIFFC